MFDVQVMQTVIATVNTLANISVRAAIVMIGHTFLVRYCVTGILPNFQCRILHLIFSGVFLTIHCLALRRLRHPFYCTKRFQCLMRCAVAGHSCFIWVHLSTHVRDQEGMPYCIVVYVVILCHLNTLGQSTNKLCIVWYLCYVNLVVSIYWSTAIMASILASWDSFP